MDKSTKASLIGVVVFCVIVIMGNIAYYLAGIDGLSLMFYFVAVVAAAGIADNVEEKMK